MKDGLEKLVSALKLFVGSEEIVATLEEMEFDSNWDAETFCNKLADDLEEEASYAVDASR